MKKNILTAVFALAVVFGAKANEVDPVTKTVKAEESNVAWKAYKVTGSHNGTINLKEGALTFDEGALTGGSFVVNMTTINTTDLEGDYKNKLDGHLNSADFFDTANHNTATLVFTNVKASGKNAYDVTGDLTIKGITKAVTFTISVYGSKATASVKVDRTNYDIKYGSGSFFDNLGDKAIYDEFDLVVDLEF